MEVALVVSKKRMDKIFVNVQIYLNLKLKLQFRVNWQNI